LQVGSAGLRKPKTAKPRKRTAANVSEDDNDPSSEPATKRAAATAEGAFRLRPGRVRELCRRVAAGEDLWAIPDPTSLLAAGASDHVSVASSRSSAARRASPTRATNRRVGASVSASVVATAASGGAARGAPQHNHDDDDGAADTRRSSPRRTPVADAEDEPDDILDDLWD